MKKNRFLAVSLLILNANFSFLSAQELSCHPVSNRFHIVSKNETSTGKKASTEGMILIKAGEFMMGASDSRGRQDEYPQHKVKLNDFYMDATEVTNAQFAEFVKQTGYITTAERIPDWNELKKQLPEGTAKPADSLLVAASLVFKALDRPVPLDNPGIWWDWKKGASWKHPQGPKSTIQGKENYPVVQVSWEDANAYAKWAGKRLPTEAEYEYAARGGLKNMPYPWGSEEPYDGKPKANTWDGTFPYKNTSQDGFQGLAPVKNYQPNGYGLYDISGNVWEWCSDNYNRDYYKEFEDGKMVENPKGAVESYDPQMPGSEVKVIRGGSFMCNESYCSGYRVSSRMMSSADTSLENTGFRCVMSLK